MPESIARFIEKRDGLKIDPHNIYLYNGASEAIASVMQKINVPGDRVGFMIPIPQYPLYSAQVQLNGAHFVGYHLDEENGWELDEHELHKSFEQASTYGVDVRAIVVINPGNPTGAIFSRKSTTVEARAGRRSHSRRAQRCAPSTPSQQGWTSPYFRRSRSW